MNFNVTPAEPKAGQSVKFENISSGGEDWEWNFGDGITSTLKSPTHTYKKPGDYIVRLTVNKKNRQTRTRKLTVFDTIPNFSCDAKEFKIYTDYTFKAQVYNPYGQKIQYLWALPDDESVYAVVTDTAMTLSTLHLYFVRPDYTAPIALRVVVGEKDTTEILQEFYVNDVPTHSVLFRTAEGDYRQRIYGQRAELPVPDATAKTLLDAEQDTIQVYNGYEFALSDFSLWGIQGFHIANRKLYFRDLDGLWVANIDGAFPVPIDTSAYCYAMTLDRTDNRIYWANENGVWFMPFVGTDNNKFITTPTMLNAMDNVTLISTDPEKK